MPDRKARATPGRGHLQGAPFASWLLVALALAGPAAAADADGQFAIKGGGQQPCASFLTAWDSRNSDLSLYAGWIDGYVTGLNQFTDNTYDLAPWQATETLLGLTQSVCAQAPEGTRFMDAFFQVVRLITPSRVTEQSPVIALVHEGQSTLAYGAVIERMKTRLRDLGHGDGLTVNAAFDPATAAAVSAFQTAEGLPATGLPDQRTLFQLFRSR